MQEIEQNRQAVIHRFVAACQADERVVAAFLGGSYARDATDAYSDIDFGLITSDEAYDDFFADRKAFLRLLGEPIFLEVFSDYGFDIVFFTFPDGVECELVLGRESQFTHMHVGPYKVLLDKSASWREQSSPGPKLLKPNRSRRYAASSPGSGMTSATTSSRLWHVAAVVGIRRFTGSPPLVCEPSPPQRELFRGTRGL
jgi:predicted nucleotidyltransferase